MATRVYTFKSELARIKKELLKVAEKDALEAAYTIQGLLDAQFGRTFKHWNESGANKFDFPVVKHDKPRVVKSDKGIQLFMTCRVVDRNGKPHKLWHWLTFGTNDYLVTKRPLRFPTRKANRTIPTSLDAKPFPGWTGKWATIPVGRVRKGIPPRGWYEAVVNELDLAIKKRKGDLGTLLAYSLWHDEVNK